MVKRTDEDPPAHPPQGIGHLPTRAAAGCAFAALLCIAWPQAAPAAAEAMQENRPAGQQADSGSAALRDAAGTAIPAAGGSDGAATSSAPWLALSGLLGTVAWLALQRRREPRSADAPAMLDEGVASGRDFLTGPATGAGEGPAAPSNHAAGGLAAFMEEAGFVGFFDYRLTTDLLIATPGQCRLFGIAEDEAPPALSDWLSRFDPLDRGRVLRRLYRAMAAQRGSEDVHYRIETADGTRRLCSRVVITYLPGGRVEHISGVTMPLAALTRREAAPVDAAVDELLSGIAHEMRTPLGAMSSSLEVLERFDSDNEFATKARGVMRRQTQRMSELLEDVRDIGSLVAGRAAPATERVDLGALAAATVMRIRAGSCHAAPVLALDARPVWVRAQQRRISQVLAGIIEHALKHTPLDGRIEVRTWLDGDEGCMEIRDTADDLTEQDLAWMRGLQVPPGSARTARWGSGFFGPALVHRLVERYGGSIDAERWRAGTRITLRLPAAEPERAGGAADPDAGA